MELSKWRVSTNYIGGRKKYQVYRILDDSEVVHAGNRETIGCAFNDYELAMMVADQMNKKEEQNES